MIMGKYFLLQIKRLVCFLPAMLAVVLVLFICLLSAFGVVNAANTQDGTAKFRLAFVGSAEDAYFQKGLEVVQAYDSSRFAIETVQLDEQEALNALKKDQIDAYVLIPDDFIKEAMSGKVGSLKYVSTTGAADLSTLFKDEITAVVSDIIIACEKAMYGIDDALRECDMEEQIGRFSYDISLTYVDYILNRNNTYRVESLGMEDSLGLDGYLFSGLTVVLLTLAVILSSCVFIKEEYDLEKLLKAKGIGPLAQIAGEFSALFLLWGLVVVTVSVLVTIAADQLPVELQRLAAMLAIENILPVLAVVFLVSAFTYMLIQVCGNLVSGVLLQFFTGILTCFISGCLYPVYFFPDVIQKLGGHMPQAYARTVLASCLTGKPANTQELTLVLYGIIMLMFAWMIRIVRLGKRNG